MLYEEFGGRGADTCSQASILGSRELEARVKHTQASAAAAASLPTSPTSEWDY